MENLGSAFMQPVLQSQTYRQLEEQQPGILAQRAAQTRLTTAEAEKAELEVSGEKKLASQLSQFAGTGEVPGYSGQTTSSRLKAMSDMYAKAGLFTKAAQLATQAAAAESHEASARAANVRENVGRLKLQSAQLARVTQLLGTVKDQASWDAANNTFEQETGTPSPFKGMAYDPELVKMLEDSSMTAYQRRMLDARETSLRADLANKQSSIESRRLRDTLAVERGQREAARERRLSKSGGKDVGTPSKGEVDAARRLIGDDLSGDELDNAAFAVASQAKAMRRKNPGMSADEAIRQALIDARSEGSIVNTKTGGVKLPFIGNVGQKAVRKFAPPMQLPKSGAAKDLVQGQHYINPKDGKVYEWGGKEGWKAVGASKPGAAAEDDSEDDSEDYGNE